MQIPRLLLQAQPWRSAAWCGELFGRAPSIRLARLSQEACGVANNDDDEERVEVEKRVRTKDGRVEVKEKRSVKTDNSGPGSR